MNIYLRKISKTLYRAWSRLLDMTGDVKVYRHPLFVVYDRDNFKMTGEKIQEAVETLEPGDIVLRGFDFYLDGHFIDGDYSHGSICLSRRRIVHAVSPRVESIHPIGFMVCDRICILRPKDRSLVQKALETAAKLEEGNTPYDFDFNTDDPREVYCFELVARCYPEIKFKRHKEKYIFGLVTKDVYLASSFLDSEDLERVFEFNPRKTVSFGRK